MTGVVSARIDTDLAVDGLADRTMPSPTLGEHNEEVLSGILGAERQRSRALGRPFRPLARTTSNELVLTPLAYDDPNSLEDLGLQCVRHTRRRDFRVTDPFKDESSR